MKFWFVSWILNYLCQVASASSVSKDTGEHSDWAGSFRRFNSALAPGKTIVVGTNAGLYARAREHPSSLIISTTTDTGEKIGPKIIPMNPKDLLEVAVEGGFWSYAAGVAYKIVTDYRVNGLVLDNYRCDLPLKKGLSSSAAVCVLVARAFNRVYNLNMTTRGEMEYAYQGELVTPSRCGRMDQACAFGNKPVVMTYDGEFVDVTTVRVPKPLHLVIVDLCAHKDTVEILSKLQSCFPFAKSDDEANVQALLGPINQRIATQAIEAIECGDADALGKLMAEAQGIFDEYAGKVCPSQLTAPVLHKTLAHEALKPHIFGGKGVGAGGDGTAQFLCRSPADQQSVADILMRDFAMPSLFVTIAASQPVRKAIIPAAGFDAAFFPATRCTRPELFPVFDVDGVPKPAILVNVEQLLKAGIEEVIIVVQTVDLPIFTKLFHERLDAQNYHKLTEHGRRIASSLMDVGKRVRFVVQERQEGLGHAIWCAKEALREGPFLVMLGDHIYRDSSADVGCVSQLLSRFGHSSGAVLGLKESPISDAHLYGCVTGTWDHIIDGVTGPLKSLTISELIEKPSPVTAKDRLATPAVSHDSVLSLFGLSVFNPSLLEILDNMVTHNMRGTTGNFELTDAVSRLRSRETVSGLLLNGIRHDLGHPRHYVEALTSSMPTFTNP